MVEEGSDDEFVKTVASQMYGADAHTTAAALSFFFLAKFINLHVQKKAQADLDAVLGGIWSCFPTLADAPQLPYIEALVEELMRWHLVAPLSLPHALRTDDIYDGHFLPAGTAAIANFYAELHDPALFPDPGTFKPKDYLPRDQGGTFPDDTDAPALLCDVLSRSAGTSVPAVTSRAPRCGSRSRACFRCMRSYR